MDDKIHSNVLHILDEHRDELLYHVTETLIQRIPMIGVPDSATNKHERHQKNMELTAQRFHQIVQAGASIDWSLVGAEYGWAGRKLSSMGATWEHQQVLLDAYFAEAHNLQGWTDEQRAALDDIAAHIRAVAEAAYSKPEAT